MKYLILGSGSFAGQVYFSHLLSKGQNVFGVNRSQPHDHVMWPWRNSLDLGDRWLTAHVVKDLDVILNFIDTIRPNIVIDFMGQGMVAPSWQDPALWFHTNITQKSKILLHLSKSDFLEQYLRASTPEVFGSSEHARSPLDCFDPSTPYAVSHASIDSYIRCLGRSSDFPYKIGRFSNFYGVGQQLYRVIPRLILSCLTNTKFVLDGGGHSLRSFINSSDICSSFDCLISHPISQVEYHFSGDQEISIAQLVSLVCSLCHVDEATILTHGPERVGKDMCYRLNCSQALVDLNWKPSISLTEGISFMIDWVKSNLDEFSSRSWNYEHKV